MSHNYEALKRRLNSLAESEGKAKTVYYGLDIETDENYQGGEVYQLPDQALTDIYADAKRRRAQYIGVVSFPFSQGQLRGRDIGYIWSVRRSNPIMITAEEFGSSYIYAFGSYGTLCEPLVYPDTKPEREYLDILINNETSWIQRVAGCSSVEEFVLERKQENPELYPPEWQTDTQKLKQLYESQ